MDQNGTQDYTREVENAADRRSSGKGYIENLPVWLQPTAEKFEDEKDMVKSVVNLIAPGDVVDSNGKPLADEVTQDVQDFISELRAKYGPEYGVSDEVLQ